MTTRLDLDDPTVDPFSVAQRSADEIRSRTGVDTHDIALVLGSGWGAAADLLGVTVAEIPATELTGFSAPALEGHVGTVRSVRIRATSPDAAPRHALVLGARTHFYEGKGVRRVVQGVRTAAAAGARVIVLTNGCGGLVEEWGAPAPVLISDHINLTAASPIEGATFVDLTDLYSTRLRDVARTVDSSLPEGVYVQFRGPHYETPAEVQMVKRMGGHLVGMSTALEAIAARQSGLEVLGISLVTNLAAGISPIALSHGEVLEAGQAASARISVLLAEIVRRA